MGRRPLFLLFLSMKKLFKKEILRIGEWNHPSAPEGKLKITKQDLDEIVDNFQYYPTVPVIRGHHDNEELNDKPELIISKNVQRMYVEGDALVAEFDLPETELDDNNEPKSYNDVSVSLQSDYEDHESGKVVGKIVRHIGMVISPFVKKLQPFTALSEPQPYLILFSDNLMEDETKTESTEETTETVVTEEVVEVTEEVETKPEETQETEEPAKEEPTVEDTKPTELAETSEDIKRKLEDAMEKNRQLESQIRLSEAEKKFTSFLNKGQLLPVMKDVYISLQTLPVTTIDLADGKKTSVVELVDRLISSIPALVNLSEKGTNTETGSPTGIKDINLEESMRKNFKLMHPDATEEEFLAHVKKNKQIIEQYDRN